MNRRPLYIPIKTLDSDDYIEGIGNVEVVLIASSVLLGIFLGIFFSGMMQNNLAGVVTALIVSILAIGIFKRDNTNENMLRKFSIIWKFMKKQKRYLYDYYNILEHMDIEDIDHETEVKDE